MDTNCFGTLLKFCRLKYVILMYHSCGNFGVSWWQEVYVVVCARSLYHSYLSITLHESFVLANDTRVLRVHSVIIEKLITS